ncbi:hypothetical protein [Clostridium sp. ATCC 25772]|uniref:hypothetical protein n=1 Tax=Clostridium sp. ATCC 25772 TaxID=1676991 RepID=UPI000782ADC5|nr:hypothetical protein [Clostridium sp. ATCC 25772]
MKIRKKSKNVLVLIISLMILFFCIDLINDIVRYPVKIANDFMSKKIETPKKYKNLINYRTGFGGEGLEIIELLYSKNKITKMNQSIDWNNYDNVTYEYLISVIQENSKKYNEEDYKICNQYRDYLEANKYNLKYYYKQDVYFDSIMVLDLQHSKLYVIINTK